MAKLLLRCLTLIYLTLDLMLTCLVHLRLLSLNFFSNGMTLFPFSLLRFFPVPLTTCHFLCRIVGKLLFSDLLVGIQFHFHIPLCIILLQLLAILSDNVPLYVL